MGHKLTFEWDKFNEDHIVRHSVSRGEFEDVFRHPMFERIIREKNEDRINAAGKTSGGRYLFVSYTMRDGRVRAVTAYTLPRKWREIYDAEKAKL